MHRPKIDWERAEQRHQRNSVEQRIFDGLKKMIELRKTIPAFADFNNRELIATANPHLFAFWRTHPLHANAAILVVANFDASPRHLNLKELGNRGMFQYAQVTDLVSGEQPALFKEQLVIPAYRFYWLTDQQVAAL